MFHTAKPVNVDSIKDVYVLQPGSDPDQKTHIITISDILSIRNLQNPNLISGLSSGMSFTSTILPYRVDADSTVALPVIGRVNLVGLTMLQAEKKLTEIYQKPPLMLRDPIINITVTNAKVTLLGEANRQGNFLLVKERTTLIELLGEAGGLNVRANKKTVQIIRGNPKNPQVIYVNLRNINALASDKLLLQNNDIIYIQPNRFSLGIDQLQQILPYISAVTLLINTGLLIDRITSR
ncbi:polysaccharide biosynthesis/export family protein [Mucilaginibacter terrae]|uniref:Polysaccharide export outer membrane protein n=1 Tax=Mucilaginibacter terrae TaxID=1955052 RepID=A0ABU3GYD7_9SPHI|nr:polysaccharide biosynthesis/export family protein [Mucilaginibacter terrae]MDT3404794.1 polysaccharide export outer membrane protein [Mucilaginibacter terrae]